MSGVGLVVLNFFFDFYFSLKMERVWRILSQVCHLTFCYDCFFPPSEEGVSIFTSEVGLSYSVLNVNLFDELFGMPHIA